VLILCGGVDYVRNPSTCRQMLLIVFVLYLGKRESSAKFESTAITPYKSENAQFEPLLVIECRGLEFTGFDPRVSCYI
jgi:hypothetical protein